MCLCSLNCKVSVNANYARFQSHQYSNLEIQFHVLGCKSKRHSQQLWEESLTTAFHAFCPLSKRGFTFWRRERCWRNTSPAYKLSRDKFCSLERLHFLTKNKGVLKRSTKILIVSKQSSRCSGEQNTNFGRKSWNKVLNEEQKATAVIQVKFLYICLKYFYSSNLSFTCSFNEWQYHLFSLDS